MIRSIHLFLSRYHKVASSRYYLVESKDLHYLYCSQPTGDSTDYPVALQTVSLQSAGVYRSQDILYVPSPHMNRVPYPVCMEFHASFVARVCMTRKLESKHDIDKRPILMALFLFIYAMF